MGRSWMLDSWPTLVIVLLLIPSREELHAMDYLVYAYLQTDDDSNADQVIHVLKNMPKLDETDFKIAYGLFRACH